MREWWDIVRGDELVGDDDAKRVFRVLGPVVDAAPSDEQAVDAARSVIERMTEHTPLAAVLDWWLIVTTGHKTANGHAYTLPEAIDGSLRAVMEVLRDLGSPQPAVQWLAARRDLDERLTGLDDVLDVETYGRVKLGAERSAWSTMCSWYEDDVVRLRAGEVGLRFDLDEDRFHKELKDGGVDENSRRWKEMTKRAKDAVAALQEVAMLVDAVDPRRYRVEVPEDVSVPESLRAELAPLDHLLLQSVLHDAGQEHETGVDVVDEIRRVAETTDDTGRYRLADVVDTWLEVRGATVPSIDDHVRTLADLRERLGRLRAVGVNVDEAEVHLLDYEIDQARSLVEAAEAAQQAEVTVGRTEQRIRTHAERAGEEGLGHDEVVAGLIDEAQAALAAGEAGRAEALSSELAATIAERAQASRLARLEQARAELETLDAPPSVIFDLDDLLDRARDEPGYQLGRDSVDDVEALVTEHRSRQRDRATARRDELRAVLADPDGIPAELRVDVEDALEKMDAALELDTDVAWIDDEAAGLLREVSRRRMVSWRADSGEARLVEHIVGYCTDRMDFAEVDVRRLYAAIKTKPFVIIAGLTGSGKSSIARLVAEAMGATANNRQFRRVAVRPDWIDQSEVLGFVNPVSNRFEPGWLADAIRACERQPDRLFFVLLDEMNLAPVEQYLAEVLSAMEEARAGSIDVRVPLYAGGTRPANGDEWPAELSFPPNLVLIGTVNVDETTRPLSGRVIDRANVLQLSLHWSDRHHDPRPPSIQPWLVPFAEWRSVCTTEPTDRHHDFLVDIAEHLKKAGIGVGLRSHLELERFLANAEGVLDEVKALDLAVLQRIIPKVRGFKRDLEPALTEVRAELQSAGCDVSTAVVDGWLDATTADDDFLDGTDARVGLVALS